MYRVEMYARVRRACIVEGMGIREAAREYGLHRDTVRKMLQYSVPPGYRRRKPARRPKLEPYVGVIGQLLEGDRVAPKKQPHTVKRIFERLREEHGFRGDYTIVKVIGFKYSSRLHLPNTIKHWSLWSLKVKLVKMGRLLLRHARRSAFQPAEVSILRRLFNRVMDPRAGNHLCQAEEE